ncbi:helix-turn-helix domain-containing protein [Phytoactinopolyspora endophytica]|uniref:helix-turn-helix domain-containing protein n=1 Tax=Phytoactinopolyspora endophytica TaxID=1642495 RepID=UPI00197C5A08|nr:helix-turn-helix domain-containing protein [Phytoactinopolyspora endophytica]
MYHEWPAAIEHTTVWTSRAECPREDHLVLPDGCMDLLWLNGELVVAGPDTAAYQATWTSASYIGLRFSAGIGRRVIGVPVYELRDQRIPLAQIWPSNQVRRLTERLAGAAATPDRLYGAWPAESWAAVDAYFQTHDPARSDDRATRHDDRSVLVDQGVSTQARILEKVAISKLRDSSPPDPVAEYTAQMLGQGKSVESVAEAVGFSARQLHRRSVDAFGYGPKMLARILRLNRALDLGRLGRSPAEVAFVTGYSDQAHLAREVRSLTGLTFTSLVAPLATSWAAAADPGLETSRAS